jgi:NAD(P)-dependent dehydrogenase (short-subunit alcohol dehydrogenase family)
MNGRVALVTGGGRGIGREAAMLLSAAGTRVMIAARSEKELVAVGLEYVVADLGTPKVGPAGETERRLGPIDLLNEPWHWFAHVGWCGADPAVWRE